MARLSAYDKEMKNRLEGKMDEIRGNLPHRYLKPVREKMKEKGIDLKDRTIGAVVRGEIYNKDLIVILLEVGREYQEQLGERERLEAEEKRLAKIEEQKRIKLKVDEELKKMGLL